MIQTDICGSRIVLFISSVIRVKFKDIVLNNKNMTVNGSMPCHSISDTPYIMFSSAQKYKICRIKNILTFLICKICLLCIFMSKSSSNTMGFQLFNVLFIKVGGPLTGLTVQEN